MVPSLNLVRICSVLLIYVSAMICGCVSMPDRPSIMGSTSPEGIIYRDCFDPGRPLSLQASSPGGEALPLNSRGFSLLNWNSYKGNKKGWENEIQRFLGTVDILALQEGYLTESLKALLAGAEYRWDLATAFIYSDVHTGVLTASRIHPEALCAFRMMEPASGLPKTVLVTRYPLSGTDKMLLLVNIHMVNFTLDNRVYREQLEKTAEVLGQHDGPFILTGDFNSWSSSRRQILEEVTTQFGAEPVSFAEDNRTSFMGNIVDHIYYHGLVQVDSAAESVTTSDHNPMVVTFRLDSER